MKLRNEIFEEMPPKKKGQEDEISEGDWIWWEDSSNENQQIPKILTERRLWWNSLEMLLVTSLIKNGTTTDPYPVFKVKQQILNQKCHASTGRKKDSKYFKILFCSTDVSNMVLNVRGKASKSILGENVSPLKETIESWRFIDASHHPPFSFPLFRICGISTVFGTTTFELSQAHKILACKLWGTNAWSIDENSWSLVRDFSKLVSAICTMHHTNGT